MPQQMEDGIKRRAYTKEKKTFSRNKIDFFMFEQILYQSG